MIIPCIDLQRGRAVQLERGRRCRLTVKDSLSLIDRFQTYGVLHVIDLDAAMRRGGNGRLVRALCREAARRKIRVRVGGGIHSVARAERVLSLGAEKIARVGRKRVILALDSEGGRIVVRGWRRKLSLRPQDVMPALEKYCSEFLCTYVDAEGMMCGTNLKWFRSLRRATNLPITAAGGIRDTREIKALERLRMNAAVGMALYRGRLGSPPRRRRPHRSSSR
jgi:phosphoribosylformimino-5-aminoimidazole carboxamide ribotide isomerase